MQYSYSSGHIMGLCLSQVNYSSERLFRLHISFLYILEKVDNMSVQLKFCMVASHDCALNPNSGANFTHADRPNQPTSQKFKKRANLARFHLIEFKFGAEVIYNLPDGN